jgi:pimeloyl-ACP methyl ester carboxylesterase
MTSEEMAHHIAIIAKKGYGPGTNWYVGFLINLEYFSWIPKFLLNFGLTRCSPLYRYKGGLQGVDCPYNVGIPEDRNRVDLPTLLIVGIQDCVCRPEVAKMITGKWVKNLKVEELDCGHWVQAEKPKETNALFERFANELV